MMKVAMAPEAFMALRGGRKMLTVGRMTPVGWRMLLIAVWVPRMWTQVLLE